jgi:hypothetical protein
MISRRRFFGLFAGAAASAIAPKPLMFLAEPYSIGIDTAAGESITAISVISAGTGCTTAPLIILKGRQVGMTSLMVINSQYRHLFVNPNNLSNKVLTNSCDVDKVELDMTNHSATTRFTNPTAAAQPRQGGNTM